MKWNRHGEWNRYGKWNRYVKWNRYGKWNFNRTAKVKGIAMVKMELIW